MVENSKREFLAELKELMHFFNNIKNASKQNEEEKAEIFRSNTNTKEDDVGFEFRFDVNPFDKKVL